MELAGADIARIPQTNLRVPRADFVAVWIIAEERVSHEWYALGVAVSCRWLAQATVPSFDGVLYPAHAPVTKSTRRAYEELIEAEYVAAERLDLRRPRPAWLVERPGWIEGICATLRWAWQRTGPPPIQVDERVVG